MQAYGFILNDNPLMSTEDIRQFCHRAVAVAPADSLALMNVR